MPAVIYLSLLFLAFLVSCNPNQDSQSASTGDSAKTGKTMSGVTREYPVNPKVDPIATFLAGQTGNWEAFKPLEQTPAFIQFKAKMDELWKKTDSKLAVIREWTNQELKTPNEKAGTLLYPFSGADFLHADAFFPEFDTLVLLALEPIGTLPDLEAKSKNNTLDLYLNQLKKSMNAILEYSFFRTNSMAEDFKTELDGTLHVLFHFMKRTGYQVLYQENVAILPGGEVTTDLKTAPEKSYVGNRYYIRKNGQNKTKTVYYFAVNIMNTPYASRVGLVENGLETRTELVEFLKKRNIASTYLKSASYLLHKPDFSIMRDLILKESEAVLQDDSGIPVKHFDPQSFDIQLFGTYTQPIPLFAGSFQSDLKALYDSSKTVRKLPFGIGYQFQTGTSNLMLATKRP